MPFDPENRRAYTSRFNQNCAFHALVHHVCKELEGPSPKPVRVEQLRNIVASYYEIPFDELTLGDLKNILTRLPHPVDREKFFGPALRVYLANLVRENSEIQERILERFRVGLIGYLQRRIEGLSHELAIGEQPILNGHEGFLKRFWQAQQMFLTSDQREQVPQLVENEKQGILDYLRNGGYGNYASNIEAFNRELAAGEVAYAYNELGFNLAVYNPADLNNPREQFPSRMEGAESIDLYLERGHFDYQAESKEAADAHNKHYDGTSHEPKGDVIPFVFTDDPAHFGEIKEQAKELLQQIIQARHEATPTVKIEPLGPRDNVAPASGRTSGGTGRSYGPENYIASCEMIVRDPSEEGQLKLQETTIDVGLNGLQGEHSEGVETFGYQFQLTDDYKKAKIQYWVRPVKIGNDQFKKDDFVVFEIDDPAKLIGAMRLISTEFTEVSLDQVVGRNDPNLSVRAWMVARAFGLDVFVGNNKIDRMEQLVDRQKIQSPNVVWQQTIKSLSDQYDSAGNSLIDISGIRQERQKFLERTQTQQQGPSLPRLKQA